MAALIIVKTLRRPGGILCASRVAKLLRITVSSSFGAALRTSEACIELLMKLLFTSV